jgi:hypothetical protein
MFDEYDSISFYLLLILNVWFSLEHHLYSFVSFFLVGLVLCLFFYIVTSRIWYVEELDYTDILKKPMKKTVSIHLMIFSFVLTFTFFFTFSFFLFALNLFLLLVFSLSHKLSCTIPQIIFSIVLGNLIAFSIFCMYVQKLKSVEFER